MTALVATLTQPPEPVHGQVRGNQEGNPPEGAHSSEPEPEPGRTTPERLTRTDPVEKAEDELLRLKGLIEKEEQKRAVLAGEEPKVLFVEDVEGGGGVGRGVFYTGLSREKVDIRYPVSTPPLSTSFEYVRCTSRGRGRRPSASKQEDNKSRRADSALRVASRGKPERGGLSLVWSWKI